MVASALARGWRPASASRPPQSLLRPPQSLLR